MTIRQKLVDHNWLRAVVQMPPNIFATTGTNVSVIFTDKTKAGTTAILVDASKLGTKVRDGKNQKTLLSFEDEEKIISAINTNTVIEDFSVIVEIEEIRKKSYSFGAGQYFDTKIEYSELTPEEFEAKMKNFTSNLERYFEESRFLEEQIKRNLGGLKYG
jgi:type I restriction enzyme M protein